MESDTVSSPSESRSACESQKPPNGDNVHLKVLVPSVAAGAIIGRGGEAIASIQRDTETKVKMAKQTDFYPGTTERVCLIIGKIQNVLAVHNYIMMHIREKKESIGAIVGTSNLVSSSQQQQQQHASTLSSTHDTRQYGDRSQQVKILVPNTTAGMIIGKGGIFIKEIKQKSGAFIQISQKSKDVNLQERCITVAGEIEQCRQAVELIAMKISEDPQSSSCPNTSYADVAGPVASAFPTGSPYAQRILSHDSVTSSLSVCTPPSIGATLIGAAAPTLSHNSPPYLALQGAPNTTYFLNNPLGVNLLSPSDSLNLSNTSSSVGANTPSGPGIAMSLTGFPAPGQQQAMFNELFGSSPVSNIYSPFASATQPMFSAQSPTLNTAAFLNASTLAHQNSQQTTNHHHGSAAYSAALLMANQTPPNLLSVGGFYSLPPSANSTYHFDFQIPEELTSSIVEIQNDLQRQFGISIRITMPDNSGTDLSSSTLAFGKSDSKSRIVTISGTQQNVMGAFFRIQEHLDGQRFTSVDALSVTTTTKPSSSALQ